MRTLRADLTEEKILKRLREDADKSLAAIDRFRRDFEQNPAHALAYSFNIYREAAQWELCCQVIAYIGEEDGMTLVGIVSWLESEVLRGARCPRYSTSPQSDVMDTERLSAKANLLELITAYEEIVK
jgi:hypothetical protein